MKSMKWWDWLVPLSCLAFIVALLFAAYKYDKGYPFNPNTQQKVFEKVAEIMKIKIDPALLPPRVFKGSEVTNEYNNSVWGSDVGDKRSNIFDPMNNTIILFDGAQVHNLAHEYTHYFQITYLYPDYTIEELARIYDMGLEPQAIWVQNHFREVR